MMGRGLLADPGKNFQKRAVFWKTNPDFRFRIISEDLKTNFSKIPWKDFPAIHDPDGLGQTTWARWKKFPAGNLWKFLFHILKKFSRKTFELDKILKLTFGKNILKTPASCPGIRV